MGLISHKETSIFGIVLFLTLASSTLACDGTPVTITLDSSTSTTTTIESRNYPGPYPRVNNCIWQITSPNNTQVTLDCPDIDITSRCRRNYFSYSFDGVTKSIVCGGAVSVTSDTNYLTVNFITEKNSRNRGTGFSCSVSYTPLQPPPTTPAPTTLPPTTPAPTTPPPPTPAPAQCTCGQKPSVNTRIVGGIEAEIGEYPWQAMLKYYYESVNYYWLLCGGTLISDSWVLTAAHCTIDRNASDFLIFLGQNYINGISTVGGRAVSQIIEHEYYYSNIIYNDVAVMKLETPVAYTALISPACLPYKYVGNTLIDGGIGTMTGWGQDSTDGNAQNALMEVDLNLLSLAACRSIYGPVGINIYSGVLCAIDTGKGICFGDSGGPLVYADSDSNHFIVGIASFVVGGCAHPDYPSALARVTHYMSWIETATSYTGYEQC